jgi:hypothetical protein
MSLTAPYPRSQAFSVGITKFQGFANERLCPRDRWALNQHLISTVMDTIWDVQGLDLRTGEILIRTGRDNPGRILENHETSRDSAR